MKIYFSKSIRWRPYKDYYKEMPFDLFWTAAVCAQCLPLSGMHLRALQTRKFEVAVTDGTWAELQESPTP